MVKKLELAVSLGFTSTPQHSPPTCLAPPRSLILHTKRNVIITKWGSCVAMLGNILGTKTGKALLAACPPHVETAERRH